MKSALSQKVKIVTISALIISVLSVKIQAKNVSGLKDEEVIQDIWSSVPSLKANNASLMKVKEEIRRRQDLGTKLARETRNKKRPLEDRRFLIGEVLLTLPQDQKGEEFVRELAFIALDVTENKQLRMKSVAAISGCRASAEHEARAAMAKLIREEGDSRIRGKAYTYIGLFETADENTKQMLLEKVKSSPEEDRKGALWALAHIGKRNPDPKIDALLIEATNDPSEQVRLSAINNLGILESASGINVLTEKYRNRENNYVVRSGAAESLAEIAAAGSAPAFEIAVEALDDVDPVVIKAVARVLSERGIKEAIPHIRDAINKTSNNWLRHNLERYLQNLMAK